MKIETELAKKDARIKELQRIIDSLLIVLILRDSKIIELQQRSLPRKVNSKVEHKAEEKSYGIAK